MTAIQLKVKRVLDVVFSAVLIVITAPVMAVACLAVALTSRGSVIYKQQRSGLRERSFTCYKIRSMYEGAPIRIKAKNDPRVTPVGALLRKLSIDELPQFYNVLRGDMSLIGPRPLPAEMLRLYPEETRLRCAMRPGMSGLWQVRRRHENDSALPMLPDDLEYVENFSLWLDLQIALRTIWILISTRGAV